jgi:hypothetical protein
MNVIGWLHSTRFERAIGWGEYKEESIFQSKVKIGLSYVCFKTTDLNYMSEMQSLALPKKTQDISDHI